MTNETDNRTLSEKRSDAGRKGGQQKKTMTPAAIEQRQKAAELSTGPKTEDGKAASSRNAWKTGEYAVANEQWRDIGLGVIFKPCKSTCRMYPCELVTDGQTKPGGDCLDKRSYLEAFDTLMDVLSSGEVEYGHGMLAAHMAGALDILQQLRDYIRENDVVIQQPLTNKHGEIVGYKSVANPAMSAYTKMLGELGVSLPELMATPKAAIAAKNDEDAVDAIGELFGRLGRAANGAGPIRRKTIDVTPTSVQSEDE